MTIQEASERYQIPLHILREYEKWGLCGSVKKVMGDWQYDDTDLERLSTIMTLHDIGFTTEEVEVYMRLLMEEIPPVRNGCACWKKSEVPLWMSFTSRSSSSSVWITCAMKSERHRDKQEVLQNETNFYTAGCIGVGRYARGLWRNGSAE